jgi:hypothetical protein
MPTFADRGKHVVSVTDPYGHILSIYKYKFSGYSCCIHNALKMKAAGI